MGNELLEFIELQQEYLKLKKVVAAESEELTYPSENLQKLWIIQNNLAAVFKKAIQETMF